MDEKEWGRRVDDKINKCKADVDKELDTIAVSLKQVQADIQAMKEILEAWNNMKGFASGMRFISTVIKILTPIVVVFGGLYFMAKTGNWPSGK